MSNPNGCIDMTTAECGTGESLVTRLTTLSTKLESVEVALLNFDGLEPRLAPLVTLARTVFGPEAAKRWNRPGFVLPGGSLRETALQSDSGLNEVRQTLERLAAGIYR